MNFSHLRALMLGNVWLLEEGFFRKACFVIERRMTGDRLSAEEIASIKYEGETEANGVVRHWGIEAGDWSKPDVAAAAGGAVAPASNIAVINCFGMIMQHSSQVDNISGPAGTSTERLTNSLRAALADPSVKSVLFHFNSPGGGVYGIEALASEMFAARGQKPIAAQVNSQCGSAAYWLASQCDEIVVTPGGEVGSIGAYGLHEDQSKAAEAAGVKYTFISAGKYKVEGNSFEPLSDVALAALQKKVDSYYGGFVNAVARGRGDSPKNVRAGYGEGRMEVAADALKVNMADRIGTMDQTLQRMAKMKPMKSGTAALSPESIVFRSEKTESGRIVSLDGEFPPVVAIADAVIDGEGVYGEDGKRGAIRVDKEAGIVSFCLSNAVASYRLMRLENETWICSRIPYVATLPAKDDAALSAKMEAEERVKNDAFRRRRHAFRERAAASKGA